MDRVADVLGRADDDGEDDHEDDGVAVVQAVGKVVIVAHVDLGDLEDGTDEAATTQGEPSVRARTHTARGADNRHGQETNNVHRTNVIRNRTAYKQQT